MKRVMLALCAVSVSVPATAKDVIQPVQVGEETVRFNQGDWVLDLRQPTGAVQLRPAGQDHGNAAFTIGVFNDGPSALNFDITNIRIEGVSEPVRLLSKDEMVQKAKSRATWAAIATGLAGAAAAYSAANARDHYRVTSHTPRGTYRTHFSVPAANRDLAAAAITAGTGYTIANIQNQLDQTKAALGDEMIQMTTIDPGDSYGGTIFLTRFKKASVSGQMRIVVTLHGVDYPFAVRWAKKGTPMPVFQPRAIAVNAAAAPLAATVATTGESPPAGKAAASPTAVAVAHSASVGTTPVEKR